MSIEKRISALDSAVVLELTDDCVLIVNTPSGVTKKTTWGAINQWAGNGLKRASFTLTPAEVKLLNSAPFEIAPAKAGVVYRAVAVAYSAVYNSATYATDTTLQVGNPSGTFPQMRLLSALNFTGDCFKQLGTFIASFNDTLFVVGEALILHTPTADPSAGDSDIKCYVLYEEILA